MKRINYVLSHPIQYQAPLIKYLAHKGIKIKTLYRSNIGTKKYFDKDFKKKIKWDIDLLHGYNYEFLNHIGPNKVSKLFPLTIEFSKVFKNTDYIWLHGVKNWYNLIIILLNFIFYKKKILIRDEVHKFSKDRSLINILFNKLFYNLIDIFIFRYLVIGTANKDYYLDHKIDLKKLLLIPYVVDNDFFYKKNKNKNKKYINILLASKFIKRKGIDIFLNSIKKCNQNIKFKKTIIITIIGDGEEKKNIKKYINLNKLDNIRLKNFKNQFSLKKEYHNSDVFILPSRYEPWGLTINEAMAAENLIIASKNVGASKDLIKHNYNGFLFKNSNDLSNYLLKIFKNKKRLNRFKKNSLKIIKKWNFQKCYTNLLDL